VHGKSFTASRHGNLFKLSLSRNSAALRRDAYCSKIKFGATMRYAICLACIILPLTTAVCAADAKDDSQQLYVSIVNHRATLGRIYQWPGYPPYAARTVDETVTLPIASATKAWMENASQGGRVIEQYVPYIDCFEAGKELELYSIKIRKLLARSAKKTIAKAAAEPFSTKLDRCQTALGIPKETGWVAKIRRMPQ
jgi:hypothetical protein